MAPRPGRTQRIAYDTTALNSARPDLGARVGWLLSMSRLHHVDESWQDGRRFAEALADAGAPASRSLVSRWEAGSIAVSHDGLAGYEKVLGIDTGRLSSAVSYLRADASDPRARRTSGPRLDPSSAEYSAQLDELVVKAESGEATPGEWQALGWHLVAAPLVHLPAQTWEALTTRIVGLQPRSITVAYRQLSTAAMTIAGVERARDYLVDAIATYLSDPDVQVVGNPLVMLDHLPTRRAARLVLDVLSRPERSVTYRVGVCIARQKLVRGELTEGEAAELQMLVLRAWRGDPAHASENLAELIADLPDGMRTTLVNAAARAGIPKLAYVVAHGEDVKAPKAIAFARSIAEAARDAAPQEPSYDEDRMLARLVREALFHRDTSRRHTAALLIASSPFALSMGNVLLHRLEDGDPEWLRARLATLLRYVCTESHRRRMLPLVPDRTEAVAVPVTQGLGHLGLDPATDRQISGALAQRWSASGGAKLYLLGMTGSPSLAGLSRSRSAPQWQRSAARWWLDAGPGIRS